MATKTRTNDENSQHVVSPKARPVLSIGGTGGLALRALATLRGVRHSGQKRLGLLETIAVALEQGAAYKRWCEKGTPIRRVQVWVENNLVMTASPEDISVKLKAFSFNVPSPRGAVLRVMKADKDEEPVVLRNQPLTDVPSSGLDNTIDLPNGQRIRLIIAHAEPGRYDVKVAFAPERESCVLPGRDRACSVVPMANVATKTKTSRSNSAPAFMIPSQLRSGFGASVSAVVILGVLVLGVIYALSTAKADKNGPTDSTDNKRNFDSGGQALNSNARLDSPDITDSVQKPAGEVTKSNQSKTRVSVEMAGPLLIVTESNGASCPTTQNGPRVKDKHIEKPSPETKLATPQTSPTGVAEAPGMVMNKNEVDVSNADVLTSWDAQSQRKLVGVRSVRIDLDHSSPAEKSELDVLHKSFVRVWKHSSDWVVTNGSGAAHPDAILNLRFEPDKTCLGVVFIDIRDASGKLLLSAYVNCRNIPKQDHEAMFADAATLLVDKLQNIMNDSKSSVDYKGGE